MPIALKMTGITKRFGALVASDQVSLELGEGEILSLFGENGAGKTTLMNILFGHYTADAGNIEVFSKPLVGGNTKAALDAGIGMVHQHFALGENLTVLENICLGNEPLWSLRFGGVRLADKARQIAQRCGFEVDLDRPVHTLSIGEKQRVEIVKALYRDAKILVLDEPTAVLTPQEAEGLFEVLRHLSTEGLAVIFISHKLKEIMAVSDRICVLRHGRVVLEVTRAEADPDEIAKAMVGQELKPAVRTRLEPGSTLLSLEAVAKKVDQGALGLQEASFTLREREILGITGVSGNGQQELGDILNGITKPDSGHIDWSALNTAGGDGDQLRRDGVARIPADRHAEGVISGMTVWENVISHSLGKFSKNGLLSFDSAQEHSQQLCTSYDVRYDSLHAEVQQLSGGNIQKLILARELSDQPRVIIAVQPTRGLDVGAVDAVHRRLLEMREKGAGVLLITEDLDELFALSDQIAVIYKGKLSPFYSAERLTLKNIGRMMSGFEIATPA